MLGMQSRFVGWHTHTRRKVPPVHLVAILPANPSAWSRPPCPEHARRRTNAQTSAHIRHELQHTLQPLLRWPSLPPLHSPLHLPQPRFSSSSSSPPDLKWPAARHTQCQCRAPHTRYASAGHCSISQHQPSANLQLRSVNRPAVLASRSRRRLPQRAPAQPPLPPRHCFSR